MKTKAILHSNREVFDLEIEQAQAEGWKIDPANPPMLFGFMWECQMIADDSVDSTPKLTRAQILEKARSVKASKK